MRAFRDSRGRPRERRICRDGRAFYHAIRHSALALACSPDNCISPKRFAEQERLRHERLEKFGDLYFRRYRENRQPLVKYFSPDEKYLRPVTLLKDSRMREPTFEFDRLEANENVLKFKSFP